MSKSTDTLRDILLTDADGNRSRIIDIRPTEKYTDIICRSPFEHENGVVTRHRIFSEECTVEELGLFDRP